MGVFKSIDGRQLKNMFFLVLLIFLGQSAAQAASDTTLFRIKSLQDTVDAGDTVDVDLFIGDSAHLSNGIKEFELEIEYDLDICDKNHIDFELDTASLRAFFGTTFSDISMVNTTTGHVNIKVSCSATGLGTARIGRIKYIVQDNVNGRQLLKFDFFKLSAKRLSGGGGDKPVSMMGDSVLVIKGYRNNVTTAVRYTITNDIKIYPNPFTDYLQIDGLEVEQYRLFGLDGNLLASGNNSNRADKIQILINDTDTGNYILQVKIKNEWKSYHILKE